MAGKLFAVDAEARQKILKGMEMVEIAVGATLSPKGRNVALDKKTNFPQVIHDGVTVARDIELEDPFENMGAQMIKEAAGRTNDLAGDGTTQATILTYAITKEAYKAIQSGANPMIVKRGIEKGTKALVDELVSKSKKIKTYGEKLQVATVSAQDKEIGKTIADAIEKVGKDGVIAVEESRSMETEVEYREGMQYDRGLASPYFIDQKILGESGRTEMIIEDPYIFITDAKIATQEDAILILERLLAIDPKNKKHVIIGDFIEEAALKIFVINGQNIQKNFELICTNAPGIGDRKRDMLEDIAIVTGATIVSADAGRSFDSITKEDLGKARRVISDQFQTLIVDGKGKKSTIDSRIEFLKKQIDKTDSQFEQEKYQERLAKLVSGVAIIKVGSLTVMEMREKRERVIDAVGATRSAVDEGIVPGGQVALLKVSKVLDTLKVEGDEKIGVDIIRHAIEQPFKKLMVNAALDEVYKIADIKKSEFAFGVDVEDGELKDMIKAGIIDPVKVSRYALLNATSIAAMAITTHVLISDKQTPEKVEA